MLGPVVLNCGFFFFFQAEDGIRDHCVTGVQTCALPILVWRPRHTGDGELQWCVRRRRRLRVKRSLLDKRRDSRQNWAIVGGRFRFHSTEESRSEERRVGKECRSRWSRDHEKKKKKRRSR